ncbi:MAG: hypothetical protein LBD23_16775 [Oscillospiraceae bacterium]|jgi:hypothetical protein|nr:hypothetical protein [Oscillospiraceae bacterium]
MSVIRKLCLIVAHTDIVNVLSELIELQCVEPIEPDLTLDPPELIDLVKRESIELDVYEANKDRIALLTTQYTYTLVGWIPSESEPELESALSEFTCAWSIEDPLPSEYDEIPVFMKYPQFFGKLRSSGRKVFEPLSRKHLI